jgi:hypothetical protein
MGSHCSFGHLKHKLWSKEGPGVKWESNCQFDSRPQKVGNWPDLLSYRGRDTYCWKALDESYNFALDRIAIRGLLVKLWGSKVAGVPFGAISRLPLGSPGKNSHLDVDQEWSLSTLPSPIPEFQHAPLPLKVLWARERAPTPPFSVVSYLGSHLSPLRSWECVTKSLLTQNLSQFLKITTSLH